MDFKFTPEQNSLRKEFEDFFKEEAKNAPEGWVGGFEGRYDSDEGWAYHRSVADKLAEKNWLSLATMDRIAERLELSPRHVAGALEWAAEAGLTPVLIDTFTPTPA